MNRLLVLLLMLLPLSSLVAQTPYVEIGSGGGFSGSATIYRIRPDGKVLAGKGIVDITFIKQGSIRKSKAARFYRKAAKQVLGTPDYNQPGNTYKFMAVATVDKSVKLTWNDAAQDVPSRVKKLYKKIMSTVNSVEFINL
jgi:hypothetical protein